MRSLWRLCLLALCISCSRGASDLYYYLNSSDLRVLEFFCTGADADAATDFDGDTQLSAEVLQLLFCDSNSANNNVDSASISQNSVSISSRQEVNQSTSHKRTSPLQSLSPNSLAKKSRTSHFENACNELASSFSSFIPSGSATNPANRPLESPTSSITQTTCHGQQIADAHPVSFMRVFNRLLCEYNETMRTTSQQIDWKFVIATDNSIAHLSHHFSNAKLRELCCDIDQKTADSIQVIPQDDIFLYLGVCKMLLSRYQRQASSPSACAIDWSLAVLTEIPENYKNEMFNNDTILTKGFYKDSSLIDKINFMPQSERLISDISARLEVMEHCGIGSSTDARKMRAFLWLAELDSKHLSILKEESGHIILKRLSTTSPTSWTLKQLRQVERAQEFMEQWMKSERKLTLPTQKPHMCSSSTVKLALQDQPPVSIDFSIPSQVPLHSNAKGNEKSPVSPFKTTWRDEAPDNTLSGNLFKQLQDKFKSKVPNQPEWCMLYCPCENWPDNVARYYKFWDINDIGMLEKCYDSLIFHALDEGSLIPNDLSIEQVLKLLLPRFRIESGLMDATDINWGLVIVSRIPSKYHISTFNLKKLQMPHIRGTPEIIENVHFIRDSRRKQRESTAVLDTPAAGRVLQSNKNV